MVWDPSKIEINALVPSQVKATDSSNQKETEFTVHGDCMGSGDDLHLVLVRSDLRINLLHNAREAILPGLRPAEIIPLRVNKVTEERQALCTALLRERAPGTYDLIATRPPSRPTTADMFRNETAVLRSGLVILEKAEV